MRIKELVQYGLDKRTIDYYTNLGMIPFTTEAGSNYRDYGEDAVVAVKKIVILRDVGLSVKEIKEALENHSYFTTAMWNKHIEQLKKEKAKAQQHFDDMIRYAEQLRDSSSAALRFAGEFDDPLEGRIITKITAHMNKKLRAFLNSISQDDYLDSIKSQDSDISDLLDYVAVFFQRLIRLYDKGVASDATDVQQQLSTLHQRLLRYYGISVYYIYTLFKDLSPNDLGISEEDVEDFNLFIEMLGIIANWFRHAKSIEAAADLNAFASEFTSEIKAFDDKVEDSSYDAMCEIIKDICEWPSQLTSDSSLEEHIMFGIETAQDWAREDVEESDEITDEASKFVKYLLSAVRVYISHLQNDLSIDSKN